jgi:hypothetical protein
MQAAPRSAAFFFEGVGPTSCWIAVDVGEAQGAAGDGEPLLAREGWPPPQQPPHEVPSHATELDSLGEVCQGSSVRRLRLGPGGGRPAIIRCAVVVPRSAMWWQPAAGCKRRIGRC